MEYVANLLQIAGVMMAIVAIVASLVWEKRTASILATKPIWIAGLSRLGVLFVIVGLALPTVVWATIQLPAPVAVIISPIVLLFAGGILLALHKTKFWDPLYSWITTWGEPTKDESYKRLIHH